VIIFIYIYIYRRVHVPSREALEEERYSVMEMNTYMILIL
jgi:hypothetical protein